MCLGLKYLCLSTARKARELLFCSRFKIYVLMVSSLAFGFKIIRRIFSAAKKVIFPQSKNFSTVKDIFHNQGTFPQPRSFSIVKELFRIQGTSPLSRKFSTKKIILDPGKFPQTMKFSRVKEILHKKLTWSEKFSTNEKFFSFWQNVL